ncbi:MAG: hypothetical protein HY753_07650 [Nitrospirae bacterium]|nr:hypothetical protein [Nitrospirota bacterium]
MKNTLVILMSALLFSCAAVPDKKIETVFYPMPPQKPRLQFLVSITTEEDIGKKASALEEFLLGKTQSMKRIARPYDIGAAKGKIYISDRTYKKILIIDIQNKTFDYIMDEKAGALGDPMGIWVTEEDYKFVADMERKQIVVFDENNQFLRAYGEQGQFNKPLDVAVYQNRIYVCDFDKHQIIVLDKDSGKTIQNIGEAGVDPGKLYKPTHVIVDKQGNIFVNDSFNFRMQKFDSNGKFIKSFGYQGDTIGAFARPKGLDIDMEGHLYVVDTAFENVQIFDDNTAEPLLFFGGFGPTPGSMYLPSGIYIDYLNVEYFRKYADKDFSLKYLVYIGNMLGEKKLNVYAFGEWIGPPLLEETKKPEKAEKPEGEDKGKQ